MDTINLLTVGALAVFLATLVAGLVEVVKRFLKPLGVAPAWQDAIYPLLALVLGIGAAALTFAVVQAEDRRPETIVLAGLICGLTASGIWAQVAAYIRTVTQQDTKTADRLAQLVDKVPRG